jgi:hypothetical protein
MLGAVYGREEEHGLRCCLPALSHACRSCTYTRGACWLSAWLVSHFISPTCFGSWGVTPLPHGPGLSYTVLCRRACCITPHTVCITLHEARVCKALQQMYVGVRMSSVFWVKGCVQESVLQGCWCLYAIGLLSMSCHAPCGCALLDGDTLTRLCVFPGPTCVCRCFAFASYTHGPCVRVCVCVFCGTCCRILWQLVSHLSLVCS